MQQKSLSAAISNLPSKLVEENDQKYGDISLVLYIKEKVYQKRYSEITRQLIKEIVLDHIRIEEETSLERKQSRVI